LSKAGVMFREFQNEGWAIRNSIFSDCYQRVRLMCGPGIFENNVVERVGGGLTFGNGKPVDPEGGLTEDVIIRNNVFIDSALSPTLRTLQVRTKGAPVRNLEISRNVICNSGSESVQVAWADNLQVRDNLLIHPGKGQSLGSLGSGASARSAAPAGIVLERVRGARISGNTVVPMSLPFQLLVKTDAESVLEDGNRMVEDGDQTLERKLRERTRRHEWSAAEILGELRAMLRGMDVPGRTR
jgi:hypothetical protein